jgi:hypothetical protein
MHEHLFGRTATRITTGFSGILTGAAAFMDGTTQVKIEGVDSTGRPIAEWYSVEEVEIR